MWIHVHVNKAFHNVHVLSNFSAPRKFTYLYWGVGFFVAAYCLMQGFASFFQCLPISWSRVIGKPYHCVNSDLRAMITASLNALTDFDIKFMPMPLFYKLRKQLKQKFEIMDIFGLGSF